ncbi:hypothetical protein BJF90_36675 [Pseudonocardia sp. CNS-004]|nr:hypothetical protein BJF90_36675 [Pseudonocardia sp. CNS-004]
MAIRRKPRIATNQPKSEIVTASGPRQLRCTPMMTSPAASMRAPSISRLNEEANRSPTTLPSSGRRIA